jgi:NAD(P)H-dependent FMN reductase
MREMGDLPDVMTGDTTDIEPHLDRFRNADAFVIASPVYNWGPSGKVNHFLDLALDRDAMAYKPYSLLSGAGSPRSALAMGGLANQLDMELKGIGIGAGVQAAGDDYNESTGALKKDIVNRANENAAMLLHVANSLRNR